MGPRASVNPLAVLYLNRLRSWHENQDRACPLLHPNSLLFACPPLALASISLFTNLILFSRLPILTSLHHARREILHEL